MRVTTRGLRRRSAHLHIPDEEGAKLKERIDREVRGGDQVEDASVRTSETARD